MQSFQKISKIIKRTNNFYRRDKPFSSWQLIYPRLDTKSLRIRLLDDLHVRDMSGNSSLDKRPKNKMIYQIFHYPIVKIVLYCYTWSPVAAFCMHAAASERSRWTSS